MSIDTYTWPLILTLVLLALYYALITQGLAVKTRLRKEYKARGERFDRYFNEDRELLASDRKVLNVHEHMTPFLALMWLTAVFVSVDLASIAGGIYVASRLIYPFLVGSKMGGQVARRVLVATFTGYGVLAFYLVVLSVALVNGLGTGGQP